MTGHSIPLLLWLLIGLCCAASCYATLAALVHPGWRRPGTCARRSEPEAFDRAFVSVSVLKPLCGLEPRLSANLETFCKQTHPRYQLLFGVASASDPAAEVVRWLAGSYPHLDIRLVIDATPHGTNRKVANLINLAAHASHDLIVIADSEVASRSRRHRA